MRLSVPKWNGTNTRYELYLNSLDLAEVLDGQRGSPIITNVVDRAIFLLYPGGTGFVERFQSHCDGLGFYAYVGGNARTPAELAGMLRNKVVPIEDEAAIGGGRVKLGEVIFKVD